MNGVDPNTRWSPAMRSSAQSSPSAAKSPSGKSAIPSVSVSLSTHAESAKTAKLASNNIATKE